MPRTATVPAQPQEPGFDHDALFRDWLADRTRKVTDEGQYTSIAKLYEDHQRWADAAFGAAAVMPEPAFAERIGAWLKIQVKVLPIIGAVGTRAKHGFCANLRLLPAIRAIG